MRKILCGVLIFTFLFVIRVLQSGAAEKEVTYLSLADYTAAIAVSMFLVIWVPRTTLKI